MFLQVAAQDNGKAKAIVEAAAPFRTIFCSPEFESLYGFAEAMVVGRTLNLIHGPNTDFDSWNRQMKMAQAGVPSSNAYTTATSQCFEIEIILDVEPIFSDQGFVSHLLVTFSPCEPFRSPPQDSHQTGYALHQNTTSQNFNGWDMQCALAPAGTVTHHSSHASDAETPRHVMQMGVAPQYAASSLAQQLHVEHEDMCAHYQAHQAVSDVRNNTCTHMMQHMDWREASHGPSDIRATQQEQQGTQPQQDQHDQANLAHHVPAHYAHAAHMSVMPASWERIDFDSAYGMPQRQRNMSNLHALADADATHRLCGSPPPPMKGTKFVCTVMPRRKAGQDLKSMVAPVSISLETLETYASVPLSKAASELGISSTAMKKACRKLGVTRWPYNLSSLHQAAATTMANPNVTHVDSAYVRKLFRKYSSVRITDFKHEPLEHAAASAMSGGSRSVRVKTQVAMDDSLCASLAGTSGGDSCSESLGESASATDMSRFIIKMKIKAETSSEGNR
jgi:hypothetical protein